MPFFDADGARLHYEDIGGGEPVVLLHGFTSSFERNWRALGWVEPLTNAGFRVLGLDVRGHGETEKRRDPEWYETPRLARDVVALLDLLGIARASLVGFSMGAGIAVQTAYDHPARVVCVAVGAAGDEAVAGLDARPLRSDLARALAGETTDDALANGIAAAAAAAGCDRAALAAMLARGRWPGALAELRAIAVPLLVVTAGRDRMMPSSARLEAAWPGALRTHVADSLHGELAGRPEFRRAVLDFLQSKTSSADSQTSS